MPNTHLYLHGIRVDIPVGCALIFRGDVRHAGGVYGETNGRVFMYLATHTFQPVHKFDGNGEDEIAIFFDGDKESALNENRVRKFNASVKILVAQKK
jgi:hypothetical protein